MSCVSAADPRREPLTLAGRRYVVRDALSGVFQVIFALAAARTLGWLNAWLYGAIIVLIKASAAMILVRVNPAVLNARGTKQKMSKSERVFFSVFIPTVIAIPITAGLDAGAVGWTHRSLPELGIGLGLIVVGVSLITWSMAVNAFFEPTVRIQEERNHHVCAAGPYRFVRHPGYVGVVLTTAAMPLLFGSLWCWLPFGVILTAFVVRTAAEDKLLRAHLEGYEAYAKRTRYRLLPLVW